MTWAYPAEPDERILPTKPILELVEREAGSLGAGHLALMERYARHHRVTVRTAHRHLAALRENRRAPASLIDRMAVILGVYPGTVYGSSWQMSGPRAGGRGASRPGPDFPRERAS